MSEYLFVYGTLMSSAGHHMGQRLGREAERIGAATIRGRLFDLGKWPGIVDSDRMGDIVHGEVYALPNPVANFVWLDAYEGIQANGPPLSEYRRLRRRVRLDSGLELSAWVYLYQWDLSRAKPLPEGRWQVVTKAA